MVNNLLYCTMQSHQYCWLGGNILQKQYKFINLVSPGKSVVRKNGFNKIFETNWAESKQGNHLLD